MTYDMNELSVSRNYLARAFLLEKRRAMIALGEVLVLADPNADFESATCDRSRPASVAASLVCRTEKRR
jgi:hypothetical protein